MRYIIAIKNEENKGKTETIRQIASNLVTKYPDADTIFPVNNKSIPKKGIDFRLIINIKINNTEIKIGFESKGDPEKNKDNDLQKRLNDLAIDYKCNIIFCSCRTSDETENAIKKTAEEHDYKIIWTSTYEVETEKQEKANELKAKHIIELLQDLSIL